MVKLEPLASDIDLREMEKRYEDLDLGEMGIDDDMLDVVSDGFVVTACANDVVPVLMKEDHEMKAKLWIGKRYIPENRRLFMEDLCKYWPLFTVLLEYEDEETAREKRDGVFACSSTDLSKSVDEIDLVAMRDNPFIVSWFMRELCKYWPGFEVLPKDEPREVDFLSYSLIQFN